MPIEKDCTAPLRDMNVPRNLGFAADVRSAIPGIMRPFIEANKSVVVNKTKGRGIGVSKVMANIGMIEKNTAF